MKPVLLFFESAWYTIVWWVRNYETLTEYDVADKRMETCTECPMFRQNLSCGVCKCYLPAKVLLASQRCPINKWGRFAKKKNV